MADHPFDPVAFVCGGLALTAGIIVLAGGSLTDEARVLLPVGLITFGAAMFVKVARREPSPAAGPTVDPFDPFATPGPTGDGSDLDHLFAPVDDVLSTWDAERAAAGAHSGDDTLVASDADGPTGPAPDADDATADPPDAEITGGTEGSADDPPDAEITGGTEGSADDADAEITEVGTDAGPPDEEPPEESRRG